MRKQFQFHLGQQSGEYFVTGGPSTAAAPSFYFVKRTRQEAIDAACQGIAGWLRLHKTPPKDHFRVDKTARFEPEPVVESTRPKKPQKFGGKLIKKVTPNETVTVSVEV